MNRIVLAAALFAFSAPAFAQFRGDYYYRDRGYDDGWHDDRGRYGRRGYDDRDDRRRGYDDRDDRRRRDRRADPLPYGGPPGRVCVTRRGSCPQGVPVPIGTPCGCVVGGVTSRGFIR